MDEMQDTLSAAYAHIIKLCADIELWSGLWIKYGNSSKDCERLMPPKLLIGYINNLLRYLNDELYMQYGAALERALVERALEQISNIVLSDKWTDMETRMATIRLMHDAGYGVQYPAAYRL